MLIILSDKTHALRCPKCFIPLKLRQFTDNSFEHFILILNIKLLFDFNQETINSRGLSCNRKLHVASLPQTVTQR